ncbi:hypothetical protein PQX77_017073 [Marasmius sp. AFHP31]|nr:hypothetical protein PQX77_017073 [Marasmius sp. AFHP31]
MPKVSSPKSTTSARVQSDPTTANNSPAAKSRPKPGNAGREKKSSRDRTGGTNAAIQPSPTPKTASKKRAATKDSGGHQADSANGKAAHAPK